MSLAGPCGNFFRDNQGWRWLSCPVGIVPPLSQSKMKLTYRIDKADHSAFQWHHFWRSSTMWRHYGVVMFLGIMAVSYTLYERGVEFQTAVTFLVGYILIMILIFAVTSYFQLTSSIKRNKWVVGDHCFIVDDAAVCEQAGPIETRVKWIGIRKVSAGEDHAFIYYAPNMAFIVPKRAFTNESDFNRFVHDCVSRLPDNTLNPRLDHALTRE